MFIFLAHDFHSSITIIELDKDYTSVQIIGKYFEDDLIRFIKEDLPHFTYEKTPQEDILPILTKHFIVSIDGKITPFNFLGYSRKNNVIHILIEIPIKKTIKTLGIKNTLLVRTYEDQINITQFKNGNHRKTFALNKSEPICQFILPQGKQD